MRPGLLENISGVGQSHSSNVSQWIGREYCIVSWRDYVSEEQRNERSRKMTRDRHNGKRKEKSKREEGSSKGRKLEGKRGNRKIDGKYMKKNEGGKRYEK
jgi:hypothetical protein